MNMWAGIGSRSGISAILKNCSRRVRKKKDSPNPNLNWSEAVDEAICFGWIDSTKKSIDSEKYMQYFFVCAMQ